MERQQGDRLGVNWGKEGEVKIMGQSQLGVLHTIFLVIGLSLFYRILRNFLAIFGKILKKFR
jgi:hypothetical protein